MVCEERIENRFDMSDAECALTLLFDTDGQDMLILNDEPEQSIPASNINDGKLIVTHINETIRAEYRSKKNDLLISSESTIKAFEDTTFSISLAGFNESPRMIDNVRVTKITEDD